MENKKTILIVDDEAHIRRVLEIKLKSRNFKTIMARNGQEGFDIILNQEPDIVILDINMPIMDGKTLCRKTNYIKQNRAFLTIMITARIDPEDRNWVDEMKDTLLMEKPFSPARIVEAIENYFGDRD